jgi:hypothetical protein
MWAPNGSKIWLTVIDDADGADAKYRLLSSLLTWLYREKMALIVWHCRIQASLATCLAGFASPHV